MADLRSYVVGVAIADNLATPSNKTQGVAAFTMVYDGANWDMLRGTAADGMLVNLGSNNDVTVTSGSITADTELPNAAALADDTANPTTTSVGAFPHWYDGSTWDRAPGTSTDGLLVNLGANNDVTITSGSVTVSATNLDIRDLTQASDNVRVYANTAKDGSGTAYVPLVDTDGHLQVDVLTGGGVDTPATPANAYVTSSALAAGSSANLSTADLGAAKLWWAECWSSAAYKAALHTVANGTASTDPVAIGGGQAFQPCVFRAAHRDFWAVTSSGGVDGFRIVMTNLDDANAADVYATFHYTAS